MIAYLFLDVKKDGSFYPWISSDDSPELPAQDTDIINRVQITFEKARDFHEAYYALLARMQIEYPKFYNEIIERRKEEVKLLERYTYPAEVKILFDSACNLVSVMEAGGYSIKAEEQLRKDFPHYNFIEPWSALNRMRDALKNFKGLKE